MLRALVVEHRGEQVNSIDERKSLDPHEHIDGVKVSCAGEAAG